MRILAFGNSHVGAWRDAWAALSPERAGLPPVEMDFFALPERIHARYRLRGNGQFTPRHGVTAAERARVQQINGRESCDLSGYDHAVWVGAAWMPEHALALAAAGDPYPLDSGTGRPALGSGFLAAALHEAATDAVAGWGAGHALPPAAPCAPLIYGRPVYAETCLGSLHPNYAPWRDAAPWPRASRMILAAYAAALGRAAAAQGLRFLSQPDDLLTASGATPAAFLAAGGGLVDPAAPAARGDHSHMNAAFGQRCIAHLLQTCLSAPA